MSLELSSSPNIYHAFHRITGTLTVFSFNLLKMLMHVHHRKLGTVGKYRAGECPGETAGWAHFLGILAVSSPALRAEVPWTYIRVCVLLLSLTVGTCRHNSSQMHLVTDNHKRSQRRDRPINSACPRPLDAGGTAISSSPETTLQSPSRCMTLNLGLFP